jgi:hypothetical protein
LAEVPGGDAKWATLSVINVPYAIWAIDSLDCPGKTSPEGEKL